MKKLDRHDPEAASANIVGENMEQLKNLFPEAFTEGKVDFDVLKQLLGGAVDERDEKYGLNWHGKRDARQLALSSSTGTLRPCPDESVDWESTENLMIEGDNLEVLKLLQKSYSGKVKLIYIDPPYNTGKDFVYPDNFRDNIKNYLERTGQSAGGTKTSSNTEANGRFHTDWLNMIYPRLKLARHLLTVDGLLFLSVDDHEVDNLRLLCAEVFGKENFVAQFVWNTEGHTDNQFEVKVNHEYVLLFARDVSRTSLGHVVDPNTREDSNLWKGFAENSITKNGPANPPSEVVLPAGFPCLVESLALPASPVRPSFWVDVENQGHVSRAITDAHDLAYPIRLEPMLVSDGQLTQPCRVFSGWANANKLRAFIENGCKPISDGGDTISFYLSSKGVIYYRRDREQARHILSVLRNFGTTERMRSELEQLGIPFSYPKPRELLRYLVKIAGGSDALTLDFFAGSGTFAESVWHQNLEDGAKRRVVLVQLPEPLDPNDERQRTAIDFCRQLGKKSNIAEITKERLRRSSLKLKRENPLFSGDLGFRVFKLDSTNIRAWDPSTKDVAKTLLDGVEHLKSDRSEMDILYEVLLKLGLDLCVPIETKRFGDIDVYCVGGGALFACLAMRITRDEVEVLAAGIARWHKDIVLAGQRSDGHARETTCVFRDSAFVDDVAKTNLTEILKQGGLEKVRSL